MVRDNLKSNGNAFTNKFFNGKQPVSHSWLPSRHPAYDNSTITKYEYNPQKADKLLNEAGWTLDPYNGLREKDGETLLITFKTTSYNKTREDIQKEIKACYIFSDSFLLAISICSIKITNMNKYVNNFLQI